MGHQHHRRGKHLFLFRWVIACNNTGFRPYALVGERYNACQMTANVEELSCSIWWIGGKYTVSGYQDAGTTPVVDQYDSEHGWMRSPFNLSSGRESSVALTAGGSAVVAGGWQKKGSNYIDDPAVDVFTTPLKGGNGGAAKPTALKPSDAYDVGGGVVGDVAYVIGATTLYTVSSAGDQKSLADLPQEMTVHPTMKEQGAVPGCHILQNVASTGETVCAYGISGTSNKSSGSLYCYHPATQRWVNFATSVAHQGGAVTGRGSTVVVAGGFNPSSDDVSTTAAIDIFDIQSTA
eukprot:m.729685 g.729685  ORF g.729685 m.729685 type:complete len:292 (-) comp23050_c0_seq28:1997-2872(-)